MNVITSPVGERLREWRQRRRMSQLDLALEAEISTRHLSFVETGRASPSRDMLLNLAETLELPLRERNGLLLAAGFAPVFPQRPLDDPASGPVRAAMERVIAAHEPFPALAVDRHWNLVAANGAVAPLVAGVAPELLTPQVNVLRLGLHPGGLASRTENFGEWRAHLLSRLRRQSVESGDRALVELLSELESYPGGEAPAEPTDPAALAIPFRLRHGGRVLSFISTTMVFGAAREVTLSELAIETFLPADAATAAALQALAADAG
ncbi:MAG: helix-turn-helix domain-containing protein [Caulobacterales bacterium]